VLDLAHQPDEWIGIDDMVESATVMAMVSRFHDGTDDGPPNDVKFSLDRARADDSVDQCAKGAVCGDRRCPRWSMTLTVEGGP
jgi:hypothetical protein